jgi:hypothetical protein
VGDIDFKVISPAENSNKFQKTRLWKENSVEDVVIFRPTAQSTLVMNNKELSKICYLVILGACRVAVANTTLEILIKFTKISTPSCFLKIFQENFK